MIAYERDGAIMLAAAALTRSSSGQPQALGQLLHFDQWLADVADLAWIDETNLAVLGHSTAQSTDALLLVQIGGPSETLNVLNDPVGLTAGHGKNSIVLADKSDVLYEYDSGAWRRFTAGVKDPAMAG
ncbi:LpqB family beta-propeller domain-containing protein [Arcanobacterium hippocoleae]